MRRRSMPEHHDTKFYVKENSSTAPVLNRSWRRGMGRQRATSVDVPGSAHDHQPGSGSRRRGRRSRSSLRRRLSRARIRRRDRDLSICAPVSRVFRRTIGCGQSSLLRILRLRNGLGEVAHRCSRALRNAMCSRTSIFPWKNRRDNIAFAYAARMVAPSIRRRR